MNARTKKTKAKQNRASSKARKEQVRRARNTPQAWRSRSAMRMHTGSREREERRRLENQDEFERAARTFMGTPPDAALPAAALPAAALPDAALPDAAR